MMSGAFVAVSSCVCGGEGSFGEHARRSLWPEEFTKNVLAGTCQAQNSQKLVVCDDDVGVRG